MRCHYWNRDDAISPDHFIILSRFDEEDEDIDNLIGLMTIYLMLKPLTR